MDQENSRDLAEPQVQVTAIYMWAEDPSLGHWSSHLNIGTLSGL